MAERYSVQVTVHLYSDPTTDVGRGHVGIYGERYVGFDEEPTLPPAGSWRVSLSCAATPPTHGIAFGGRFFCCARCYAARRRVLREAFDEGVVHHNPFARPAP